MQPLPTLIGQKTILRPMEAKDQPFFQKWLSENEELRCMIDDRRIPTMEDQERWFERSQKPDRRMFAILALPGQDLIGNGGLVDIDPEKGMAQIRITIGNLAFQGQGRGSDALGLIIRHAFDDMHLKTLRLRVRQENERALHLYRTFGFEEEGKESGGILRMSLSHPTHESSH